MGVGSVGTSIVGCGGVGVGIWVGTGVDVGTWVAARVGIVVGIADGPGVDVGLAQEMMDRPRRRIRSLASNFGAPLQRRESAICHNRLFLRKPQGSLVPSSP